MDLAFLRIVITLFAVAATCCATRADCDKFLSDIRQASLGAIAVTVSAEKVHAGENLSITWRNRSNRLPQENPAYVVMATSPDVRFAGQGFFTLTADSLGPFGLSYGVSGARAFIPINRQAEAPKGGEIAVTFYQRGSQTITWAVVTIGSCGEHVLVSERKSIYVSAGVADLVVQDRFTIAEPRQRIRSLVGTYELRVFDGRYEVHDIVTGAKIFERAGIDPNFSPRGRFLAARDAADHAFDIIDLVSGRRISKIASQYQGFLVWVRNDSYVIYGGPEGGMVEIVNTLVDDQDNRRSIGGRTDCHLCWAWTSVGVVLDIDRGFAVLRGLFYTEVFDLANYISPSLEEMEQRDKRCDKSDPPSDCSQFMGNEKARALRYIRNFYDGSYASLPDGWSLGEEPKFSHTDTDPIDPHATRQDRFLVKHTVVDRKKHDLATLSNREVRGRPRLGRGDERVGTSATTPNNVFARLSESGIRTASHVEVKLLYKDDWQGSTYNHKVLQAILDDISMRVPIPDDLFEGLARHASMRRNKSTGCFPEVPLDAITLGGDRINQVFQWDDGDKRRWLIQTMSFGESEDRMGGGGLTLIREGAQEPVRDLPIMLQGDVWTSEALRVRPFRLSERLIAIAIRARAYILKEDDRQKVLNQFYDEIVLLDLDIGNFSSVQIPLVENALLTDIRITDDGRHVLQLNADGRFFVNRVSDGKRVIIGAYVDDEVVVATDDALYDTTFEGAQAVQVRFVGDRGLYRFYQFETTLHRPGLAESVLAGSPVIPSTPEVSAPPTVDLMLASEAANGRRAGRMIATGERDLVAVLLYVDGRLVWRNPVQGRRSEVAFDIPDPGGGRWISAVSVDNAGLLSLPSAVRIPGAIRQRGTMRAVLIGVDSYESSRLPKLDFAASDAWKLAQALKTREGRAFRTVDVNVLAAKETNPTRLLDAVQRAAHATESDDLLVIFYAGHGVIDPAAEEPIANFMLTLPITQMNDLGATAVSWTALASALSSSRGIVLVILDACHAGTAGIEAFTTNEDAVSALTSRAGAPMILLAGSKGRQRSFEDRLAKGGLFTSAIISTIAKYHRSPIIELSQLYTAVKTNVVGATNSRQTPWLTRNGLVGEVALF